ncbi:PDxFFG protein [Mesomycoplasma molare]|uniref:PDxFFG protein n=1 Tax=Mesomycoplasma molare TaxID=171288 RepID=A0ABY5TV36_9BACT|nr:PDxFFG protein [Mesomycoplasma molare]UWD34528.1 PDxFFG protein [Mesomycoplasma molare]
MLKKKLSLTAKVLISSGIILTSSAAAIGGAFLFANLSDEVNGSKSNLTSEELKNDYSKIYDSDRNLKPQLSVKDPLKKQTVALLNEEGTEFWFKNNPNTKYNFEDFFQKYYEKYEESFILEVKYGSFSFYNEYVLAVRPKQFIEFTKWFFTNVSWGPDLVTLESFRLVPGVEQNGNAITLGSHSTLHKEVSEIKFFPDAFFGSLPIYSELSGRGNSTDSLTYLGFRNLQDKKTIDVFLKSIPSISAIKNANSSSENNAFLSLLIPSKLLNKEFKVLPNRTAGENGRGTLLFNKDITEEEYTKILKENKLNINNFPFSSLEKAIVTSTNSVLNDSNPVFTLELTFPNLDSNNKLNLRMTEGEISSKWLVSYYTLKSEIDRDIKHFLDFYDVTSYKNRKIFEFTENNKKYFYKSKIEALNKNKTLKNYSNLPEDIKAKLVELTVKDIDVVDAKLHITFVNSQNEENTVIYDSKNIDEFEQEFEFLKEALGYKGSLNPVTISYGPENLSLKDEDGNPITGLDSRNYQVYYETYSGIIKSITKKYPHLLKKQNGPHIAKKLNDKGYYEYSLENGEFRGFQSSDRIGLPLVLGATLDDFQGISIDFLKYVTAHEYGHHFTLDQNKALNTGENALVIGGLGTRSGINIDSYYSKIGLKNYLLARSNLDFERVNAFGKPSEKGQFIRFKYIKDDGSEVTESDNDIWGNANPKADIYSVIKNKERRFLQTFEGLEEAAKLRNVKLRDLFLANSFDEHSGTLNPEISGSTKSFVKKEIEIDGVKKTTYVAETVTLKNILNELTDGKGNKISDLVTFTSDTTFDLEIVKLEEKIAEDGTKQTLAKEIRMFNADGTPVINIPLNEPLDKASLDFIKERTNSIKTSLENTVVTTFISSGWNTSNSFLGGTISPSFRTFLSSESGSILKSNLLNRNDNSEINPENNKLLEENNPRNSKEYLSINSNEELGLQVNNIIEVAKNFEDNRSSGRAYEGQIGNVLTFVNGSNDNYNSEIKFSFPLVARGQSRFLFNMYQNGLENNIKTVSENFDIPVNGKIQTNPAYLFARFGTNILNSNQLFESPEFIFLNEQNQISSNDELRNAFNSKNIEKIKSLVNKIAFNTPSKNFESSENGTNLYFAFSNSISVIELTTNANRKEKTIAFNNLKNFFEFASIDFSKATLVNVKTNSLTSKQEPTFNWDIEYVKTKFNFDKFKESLLANEKEQASKKEEIRNASEQFIANELMKRFRKTHYFLTIKDFNPIKELVNNQAIFSKEFGIEMHNPDFLEGIVFDLNAFSKVDQEIKYDANKLQSILKDFIIKTLEHENNLSEILETINTQDLYRLIGNIITWKNNGIAQRITLGELVFNSFNNGKPSTDVINYNLTRVEPSISDKFTDYIYSIAETLTRDYVQTTYVPSFSDFGNLPNYLKGLSESKTGLDYVVDATELRIWNERKNNFDVSASSISQAGRAIKFEEYIPLTKNIYIEAAETIEQYRQIISIYRQQVQEIMLNSSDGRDRSKEIEELDKKIKEITSKIKEATDRRFDKVIPIKNKIYGSYISRNITPRDDDKTSSYFGNFMTRNNGYFKDKVEKEKIGLELYDDQRNEIVDNTIRLKDFDGNKINTRAKAFFVSQVLNYGVGNRKVSGLFRNKEKDAVALYGFVKNEEANKIKRIRFTDIFTNEVKYLEVNFKDTNNLFYLSKQGDINSKVTLNDLGYSSWVSDYGIMAKYRDTLLKPKHKYFVDFVDENNNFVSEVSLGDLSSISENGKTDLQASIKMYKNESNKTIIDIDYQFNITG